MQKAWAWIKRYWYIPLTFLFGILIFFLSRGRRNPFGEVLEEIREIRATEASRLAALESDKDKKEEAIDKETTKKKEEILEKEKSRMKEVSNKISKEVEKLETSEEVNSELNDLL